MTLKEKFEKVLKNCKPHFLKFDTNDCIEICDDYAIEFAEWSFAKAMGLDSFKLNDNELEIFKQEKGW